MKKLLFVCFVLAFAAPAIGQITDFNFLYFTKSEGLPDN